MVWVVVVNVDIFVFVVVDDIVFNFCCSWLEEEDDIGYW